MGGIFPVSIDVQVEGVLTGFFQLVQLFIPEFDFDFAPVAEADRRLIRTGFQGGFHHPFGQFHAFFLIHGMSSL